MSEKSNPEKVRAELASLDYCKGFAQGVPGGCIKFDATGQNSTKPMSVIQIQNGKMVTVWPKDSAEGKLIWPGLAS